MKKQKNTKTSSKKRKGQSRRSRTKYPALERNKNLPSRKDYIETSYINGVTNNKGELVIRPLNEQEKEFLNRFYEETIVTNFLHDKELRLLNDHKKSIIEDETVKQLKDDLKELKKNPRKNKKEILKLKEVIRLTKKQNQEIYKEELTDIQERMDEVRQDKLLYPDVEDHKEFYRANNSRNSCLYNKLKTAYILDSIHDYEEYLEGLSDKDEDWIIEQIEGKNQEK